MIMSTISTPHEAETGDLMESLRQAQSRLSSADEDVALDLSSVRRIGPGVLKHLQGLARMSESTKTRVTLRGVSVDVYKVLKLMRLSSHFSFVD
jgi:anti-anti-sigma regulatory factor